MECIGYIVQRADDSREYVRVRREVDDVRHGCVMSLRSFNIFAVKVVGKGI